MGTMGLALACTTRIPVTRRQRETRVEPSGISFKGTSKTVDTSRVDTEIAEAYRAGDLGGYERLYALFSSRMKSLARILLGNTSDAEDAVQETFLKLQRAIATYRGQSSFVTWTFRILINACHDARRSRLRKKEWSADETEDAPFPEPHARAGHPSLRLALERAVGKLTQHQRDVFLLYEVEGFRHAEIAQVLDISETASKNTLFQAKKNLRVMLKPPRSNAAEAK